MSLPIELRKSADSTELTGKVYTDVTGSYWRQGGVRVAITMATLGSVNASYSSGGFVEVDATNQPGVYRFDVPDAALATGADWVVLSLKVSTAFVQNFMFALETKGAADLNDIAATAIVSSGAITTSSGAVSNVTATATVNGLAAGVITATSIASDAITAAKIADGAIDTATFATGTTIPRCTLVDTLTTYTSNTPQTGDSFARIGSNGVGLTAVALTGTQTFNNTGTWTGNLVGTVSTVTTLTNLPSIPSGWLTTSGIAANALDSVWSTSARVLTAGTNIVLPSNGLSSVSAWTVAITGNITGNLSGTVGTVNALAANVISAASIATDAGSELAAAIWDLATSGHTTSGTFGAAMNAAGSSGDPWGTALPGAYGAGTAGKILGDNLNATILSRMATFSYTAPPSELDIAAQVDTTLSASHGAGDWSGVGGGGGGTDFTSTEADNLVLASDRILATPGSGPVTILPGPSSVNQIVGYLYTRDGQGALANSVVIDFQIVNKSAGTDSHNTTTFSVTSSGSTALLSVQLEKYTCYKAKRGSGSWINFETPATGSSFQLPPILGTP